MAWLDIGVLFLIGGFGVRGFLVGFVTEVLSLGAVIAGILAVYFFHQQATARLAPYLETDYGAAMLAFVLLFAGVYVAGKLIAGWIGRRTRASSLGAVDRMLGLGFGALKGLLFASVAFVGFTIVYNALYGQVAPRPTWVRFAHSYPLINASSEAMSAWVAKNSQDGGILSDTASGEGTGSAGKSK